jgi:outer membrane protein TolC
MRDRWRPSAPRRARAAGLLLVSVLAPCGAPGATRAQAPAAPTARVSFDEAVRRALARNPSVATAAAGIIRAEGLLGEARAVIGPQINASVTTTTLNTGVEFSGVTVTPRNQVSVAGTAQVPILAAAAWARRAQAQDTYDIAELTLAETKRQTALAAADAYLTIVALHHVADADIRARDVAKAHFDLATELENKGSGSHLNTLRAQAQHMADEQLVEVAQLRLYRAQEALGVLMVANGPVDAADEPALAVPPIGTEETTNLVQLRADLKLFSAEQLAAERVVRDTSKEYWPTVNALFQPQSVYPGQFFLPQNSWRFLLQMEVPLFDFGQRASLRVQRQAAFDAARATYSGALTQASSEVRAAREAIASAERTLIASRAAADEAQQVVGITNVAFRSGAATNIEVIDAQRSARDADTAVAAVEDSLRRARLELLVALGRFP